MVDGRSKHMSLKSPHLEIVHIVPSVGALVEQFEFPDELYRIWGYEEY
jgi:hypothetical protein